MIKWKSGGQIRTYLTGIMVVMIVQLLAGDGINRERLISPGLIRTEHPTEPWIIGYALDEVPGIEVDRTGKQDVSAELQRAVDWVWESGGGVLYIPAGEYRLDQPIEVPPLVGLRGDFIRPGSEAIDRSRNTVLAIYHGRGGSELDRACISLDGSASIDGFVIWYPEQSGKRVKPYTPAIQHVKMQSVWGINTSSRNLFMVNAYHAIAIGEPGSGTCIQLVKNVSGTPLGTGIEIWSDADIPRLLNLDFDPAHLGYCGLPGMAKFETVAREHLLKHASAIRYHRTDGSELADIRVRGYRIGLELLNGTQTSSGHWIDNEGHYINFDFRDCMYGVWIDNIKDHGTQFFSCHLDARKSAVFINNPHHNGGVAMFLKCSLSGGESAVAQKWKGKPNNQFSFMFTECTFGNTVNWDGGSVSILGSQFQFDGTHARIGKSTLYASLVDNQYQGKLKVIDNSGGKLVISDNKWKPLDVPEYAYRVNHGSTYHPARPALYVATDFGARSSDGKDDSKAIQAAIDKCSSDGGGYVLVPAGKFRIDFPVTVRKNVELRGVTDFWQHSRTVSYFDTNGMTRGSLLLINHGKGDQDSCTFLLEEDAGINGISIHYPGQAYDVASNVVEEVFPWLFRLKGDRSYLKHVMASNPWRMVDAFTYSPADIYLGYLCGAPLDVSVQLGENHSPMLDNIHFNSWYWNHVFWDNKPSEPIPGHAYKQDLDNWMKANSKAFIMEGTRNLDMYGCFQFCARQAFTLKKGARSGLGPSGLIINSGNDWSKYGLYAHANNGLKFINMHFIDVNKYDDDPDIASIYFAPEMADTVKLYQVSTWGTSPRFVWMNGTTSSQLLIVNLSYQLYNVDQFNRIDAGQLTIKNAIRRRDNVSVNFRVQADGRAVLNAFYFPFSYTVTPENVDVNQWIDRFGSTGL